MTDSKSLLTDALKGLGEASEELSKRVSQVSGEVALASFVSAVKELNSKSKSQVKVTNGIRNSFDGVVGYFKRADDANSNGIKILISEAIDAVKKSEVDGRNLLVMGFCKKLLAANHENTSLLGKDDWHSFYKDEYKDSFSSELDRLCASPKKQEQLKVGLYREIYNREMEVDDVSDVLASITATSKTTDLMALLEVCNMAKFDLSKGKSEVKIIDLSMSTAAALLGRVAGDLSKKTVGDFHKKATPIDYKQDVFAPIKKLTNNIDKQKNQISDSFTLYRVEDGISELQGQMLVIKDYADIMEKNAAGGITPDQAIEKISRQFSL